MKKIFLTITKVLLLVVCLTSLDVLLSCAKNPFYNTDTTKTVTYYGVNWAPDGRVVAFRYEAYKESSGFAGNETTVESHTYIVLIDTINTKNEEVLGEIDPKHNITISHLELSGSMKYVAAGYEVYQVSPWQKVCNVAIGDTGMEDFDWSPDETEIAAIDVSYNIRIYDAMNGNLKRVINQEKAYGLCWKYKERIALTGENYLWFIKSDGTGYVTANFDVRADTYDKTKDYLYSYYAGFNQVSLNNFQVGNITNERLNTFIRPSNRYLRGISSNGLKYVYCAAASEGTGIYVGKSDGSDQIIELR